ASGLTVLSTPTWLWYLQLFDHGTITKALKDVRVRQALNYAIDRKTIAHALLGPAAVPVSSPDAYQDGDDPRYTNYYAYNPSKGRALLAAAGYAKGLTLKFVNWGAFAGSAYDTSAICNAVKENYAAVGVQATCVIPSTGDQMGSDISSKIY